MSQLYKINILNALVFIICGIIGFAAHYFQLGDFEQTALIPFVLGMLLMVMTPGLKNGNGIIRTSVMVLTFLFGMVVMVMLLKYMGNDKASARKMILLTVIAISSFTSFAVYLNNWVEDRKLKKRNTL